MRLLLILLVSFIISAYSLKWEDCGIPLTRKIYFQNVVVSPSNINIAEETNDRSISINVGANIQNYNLGEYSTVSSYIQLMKEGEMYVDTLLVGDLCSLLAEANGVSCVLPSGAYSFSYKYQLPPVPTGNYTLKITFKEDTTGHEIGCLSTSTQVIGLGLDACSYTSSLTATFAGKAYFLAENTVIQIGPRALGGYDTQYEWGTFKSVVATPDLVGYSLKPTNYVWGLRGNLTSENTFEGYVTIGYLPDANNYENAQLIYQGLFTWHMKSNSEGTPYLFESGTFYFVPTYFYPDNFPYPLNIGNLGNLTISQSADRSHFSIAASKKWCRCNCLLGGSGRDDLLKSGKKESSMSSYKKGTIAIAVIGSVLIVAAIILVIKMRRSRPRPVVYDDADLMDPQKPDYGTMAINEAFEAEDQEYN